jgi:hypothetical protein
MLFANVLDTFSAAFIYMRLERDKQRWDEGNLEDEKEEVPSCDETIVWNEISCFNYRRNIDTKLRWPSVRIQLEIRAFMSLFQTNQLKRKGIFHEH